MDIVFRLDEIEKAAQNFIKYALPKKVIAFHGEMGTGKTTFIKAICQVLGVNENVSSPTFSIINQYETFKGEKLYHLDLYRLQSEEEATMAGIEECFYSGNWCFIEWPEKTPGLLPEDSLHCYLTTLPDNQRKLQIKL